MKFNNKKQKASQLTLEGFVEGKGFEPSVSLRPTHAFQACSLNHSDTPLNGLQNYDLFRRIEKAVDILFELN